MVLVRETPKHVICATLHCRFQLSTQKKMKIYFAHGKESGPWGSKIKRLAGIAKDLGCAVESIDYTAGLTTLFRRRTQSISPRRQTAPCI